MPLTMQFHPAGGMAGRLTCEHVIMHACTVKAKLFDCNDAQAEAVRALLEGRTSAVPEHVRRLIGRIDMFRLRMSYNDSYFGEPAGLLKGVFHDLAQAVNPIYPSGKTAFIEADKPAADSSHGCIAGEMVEAGDDDDGNPRLVISATREAIKAGVVNMLFKPVLVMSPADIPKEDERGVFAEIQAERVRQDEQWGGPEHDDTHGPADWCDYIERQLSEADGVIGLQNPAAWRERMVKIAALAVAAIESHDRVMARSAEASP